MIALLAELAPHRLEMVGLAIVLVVFFLVLLLAGRVAKLEALVPGGVRPPKPWPRSTESTGPNGGDRVPDSAIVFSVQDLEALRCGGDELWITARDLRRAGWECRRKIEGPF